MVQILNLKPGEVGAAPGAPLFEAPIAGAGVPVDTSAIDAAMAELNKKYSDTSVQVGDVKTSLKEIPQKILALRAKGGGEMDAIRQKLKEAEEEANKDVSGYLATLADSIKKITIDGLEGEMNTLKAHQKEINDALDNAGKKDGAPAGPAGPASPVLLLVLNLILLLKPVAPGAKPNTPAPASRFWC